MYPCINLYDVNCNNVRFGSLQFEGTLQKIGAISHAIALQLRQQCQCSFTEAYIAGGELSCGNEASDVIFRARLFATQDASNIMLISILEQWVTSATASIVIQGIRLELDPACTVEIQSFTETICLVQSAVTTPTMSPVGTTPSGTPSDTSSTSSLTTSPTGKDCYSRTANYHETIV